MRTPVATSAQVRNRTRRGRGIFLLVLLAFFEAAGAAETSPASIDTFVASAFAQAPEAATLWLTPAIKTQAVALAGFAPGGARIRYWHRGQRSAWVLDRVGKEAPITFGVIVEDDAIVALRVLTYRESRGYEIQSPRWLAQYAGVRAGDENQRLDRAVDNISGATLSVRASRDVVRLALFLHRTVMTKPAAAEPR